MCCLRPCDYDHAGGEGRVTLAAKKKRGRGRPKGSTKRTKKLDDALVAWLSNGKTLRKFCEEPNTPTWRTIYNWMLDDQEYSARLARAREAGAQMIEDQIEEIADSRDMNDPDDVQHRKLRIYAREKRLTWNNPEKYGKKQQIEQKVEHVVLTDTERSVRVQQLLDKAKGKTPQIEVVIEDDEDEEDDNNT